MSKKTKQNPVRQQPAVGPSTTLAGRLAGIDDEGRVLFKTDASGEVQPVAIGVPISDGAVVKAAILNRRALVLDTDGGPVLIAIVRERVGSKARDAAPGDLEVSVDGEVLQFRADKQIEFCCGKSKILLRKDGRIHISGSYVITSSRGPNKIKGATIALN